jgi:hypothetical protein
MKCFGFPEHAAIGNWQVARPASARIGIHREELETKCRLLSANPSSS